MPKLRKPFVIENIPQPKKEISKVRKLGLIKGAAGKMCTFRLRYEAIEGLAELAEKVNKKTKIKVSKTQVLEVLIMDALKSPSHLVSILNS